MKSIKEIIREKAGIKEEFIVGVATHGAKADHEDALQNPYAKGAVKIIFMNEHDTKAFEDFRGFAPFLRKEVTNTPQDKAFFSKQEDIPLYHTSLRTPEDNIVIPPYLAMFSIGEKNACIFFQKACGLTEEEAHYAYQALPRFLGAFERVRVRKEEGLKAILRWAEERDTTFAAKERQKPENLKQRMGVLHLRLALINEDNTAELPALLDDVAELLTCYETQKESEKHFQEMAFELVKLAKHKGENWTFGGQKEAINALCASLKNALPYKPRFEAFIANFKESYELQSTIDAEFSREECQRCIKDIVGTATPASLHDRPAEKVANALSDPASVLVSNLKETVKNISAMKKYEKGERAVYQTIDALKFNKSAIEKHLIVMVNHSFKAEYKGNLALDAFEALFPETVKLIMEEAKYLGCQSKVMEVATRTVTDGKMVV